MTYVCANGAFGALGHGISDGDTGLLVQTSGGELYDTEILGVEKGSFGKPGVMSGVFTMEISRGWEVWRLIRIRHFRDGKSALFKPGKEPCNSDRLPSGRQKRPCLHPQQRVRGIERLRD